MTDIILTSLNAKYIHSSLALRYLKSNMGELYDRTSIIEFNINIRPIDVVEKLLSLHPSIIGFSVYIWNIEQTTNIIHMLKKIDPEISIIIGGPEVSYEYQNTRIFSSCDYLIPGQGDIAFSKLCTRIFDGNLPDNKYYKPESFTLSQLSMPYDEYTEDDIANRIIYVEASRGCPFKCEFCLSALDKTAYPFDLDLFLVHMQRLYDRGARHFKFVDRTFNLNIKSSMRIMNFFLEKIDEGVFLHFELIPDHLPEKLKTLISQFPAGSLQFEIGIQSMNKNVQSLISRKQDNEKSLLNIQWLRQKSHAHIHTDLIVGLPGENIASFEDSFNQLINLNPHEIQIGILKRLKGSPIIRHTGQFKLCFNSAPPYNILETADIDFMTMQRLSRFSRYWDLIANSGRFNHSKPVLLQTSPFANFMQLSDWLYQETGQTHRLALDRLFKLLYKAMTKVLMIDKTTVETALLKDFECSGIKGQPVYLKHTTSRKNKRHNRANNRQQQHQ
ncbi:MAG: DUF4080 domain-containing protein [Gammaproteobacteria bacterium]|nr:DUF4080 domain-containing protein [Gammaproteobacteria bacterium]